MHSPRQRRGNECAKDKCIASSVDVSDNTLRQQHCHVEIARPQRLGHCAGAAWVVCPSDVKGTLSKEASSEGRVPWRVEVLRHATYAERVQATLLAATKRADRTQEQPHEPQGSLDKREEG